MFKMSQIHKFKNKTQMITTMNKMIMVNKPK